MRTPRAEGLHRDNVPVHLSADRGLLSIGYEGRDAEELIAELSARRVHLLADVRLNPISRKRGLSKLALTESLNRAQIEYLHLPALGNPKDNRDGFRDVNDRTPRTRYRQLLASPAAEVALSGLAEVSDRKLVGIMCFEREETECHRELILDLLRERHPMTPIQRV